MTTQSSDTEHIKLEKEYKQYAINIAAEKLKIMRIPFAHITLIESNVNKFDQNEIIVSIRKYWTRVSLTGMIYFHNTRRVQRGEWLASRAIYIEHIGWFKLNDQFC